MNTNSELWSVPSVAAHLGVSRRRVYQLIREGRLDALRLGPRGTRIPRAAVERLVRDQLRAHRRHLLDLHA